MTNRKPKSVEQRLEQIEQELQHVRSLYDRTLSYRDRDPVTALIHARIAAEAICKQLFVETISPSPGNLMLDGLIEKLQAAGVLPKRIYVPLRTIQSYGNFATHDQGVDAGEDLTTSYIQPCLQALAVVVDWYFSEHRRDAQFDPLLGDHGAHDRTVPQETAHLPTGTSLVTASPIGGLDSTSRPAGAERPVPTKRDKAREFKQAAFIGRQALLDRFRLLLPLDRADSPDILVLHGIGGIGKSALLSQFERLAREVAVPTARIDPQVQATIFDFLQASYRQLGAQGIAFPRFEQGLRRHRTIESKVLEQSTLPPAAIQVFARGALGQESRDRPTSPVVRIEQGDAVSAHIYRLVGRVDGDFWMKPEDELTALLVADLNEHAASRRLVLLLDTYELMGAFDDWVREHLFANLAVQALLVIAGRRPLSGAGWQEYLDSRQIAQVNLQPLSATESQAYLLKMGVPTEQLTTMASYAAGHPLTLSLFTTQVGQPALTDFARAPERLQVIPILLERIVRQVSSELRATLEAGAILRVVNEESLAMLLEQPVARDLYEDLLHLDFVKYTSTGVVALHDVVRDALNEELRQRSPRWFRTLNERAARYYQDALAGPSTEDRERYLVERLFHLVQADEEQGFGAVQEAIEPLVRAQLIPHLRQLLGQVETFDLRHTRSVLWVQYYRACLAEMESHQPEAEATYRELADRATVDARLQAYALCDLARILSGRDRIWQSGGVARVRDLVQRSSALYPADYKLVQNFYTMSDLHLFQLEWEPALRCLESVLELYDRTLDRYGIATAYRRLQGYFGVRGDWKSYLASQEQGLAALADDYRNTLLHADLLVNWAPVLVWMGRCTIAEANLRTASTIIHTVGRRDAIGALRDLSVALAAQRKFAEATAIDAECNKLFAIISKDNDWIALKESTHLTWRAVIKIQQGDLSGADQFLQQVLQLLNMYHNVAVLGETWRWLGLVYELQQRWPEAVIEYSRNADNRQAGRLYHECGALTGLVRAHAALGDYTAIPPLIAEAQELAQRYEYNDHLASLHLSLGHLAWDHNLEQTGGLDVVLAQYQQALVYALRFNRFLLDEVLWGGGVTTPLRPIIMVCLEHGEAGRHLLDQLAQWWHTGANDLSSSRPQSISLVPERMQLLEAERLARQREVGDGAPQQAVVDHLRAALRR